MIVGRNGMYGKKLRRFLIICAGLDEEEGRDWVLEETIQSILSLQELMFVYR